MGSILTNNAALVALQTLSGINRNLNEVQDQISTGLAIGSASDDAAIFAISQVARSDVSGFEAVQGALDLGASNLSVAANATDQISDILNDIRGLVVQAGEAGFDPNTINNEITSLTSQIQTVVDSAQFNGTNLLDGSTGTLSILGALSRDAAGAVSTSNISLTTVNLNTTGAGTARAGLGTGTQGITAAADNTAFELAAGAALAANVAIEIDDAGGLTTGDVISVTIDGEEASITVTAEDVAATNTENSIASRLRDAINNLGVEGLSVDINPTAAAGPPAVGPNLINFINNGAGNEARSVVVEVTPNDAGGLAGVGGLNVSAGGPQIANLGIVDAAITSVINFSAAIGTTQARVEIQADFQQSLIDNFNVGIGSLVDADLEEASARLQSLQVQQQLATQSLSIANQAPQSILALFR
ncbi:MAG: flagellin [Pseudomonadota bacterium]